MSLYWGEILIISLVIKIFLTEMIMVVVMMMFEMTIFQKMDYVSSSGNTAMVESIMLDLLTLSQKDMKQI